MELQVLSSQLNAAVEDFNPCYKEFVGSIMDCLDSCNSDFIVEYEKLLRVFKDDKVKKAWEAACRYAEDVEAVYNVWNDVDMEIAKEIQKGKNNADK